MSQHNFADNPNYTLAFEHGQHKFYTPSEVSQYHKSRELAMQNTERYAISGISKEVLAAFANKMVELCNNQLSVPTLRTDMSVIANNLLARMRSPVDDMCSIRMGALAVFMDGEDPDRVMHAWTERKMSLAKENPEILDFFLSLGIALIPEYETHLRTSTVGEYLESRKLMLDTLTLP